MVLLVSVILFRFPRFGCFGGFVLVVLVVSLISVVSFRWFRFVVSGFSTCFFDSKLVVVDSMKDGK